MTKPILGPTPTVDIRKLSTTGARCCTSPGQKRRRTDRLRPTDSSFFFGGGVKLSEPKLPFAEMKLFSHVVVTGNRCHYWTYFTFCSRGLNQMEAKGAFTYSTEVPGSVFVFVTWATVSSNKRHHSASTAIRPLRRYLTHHHCGFKRLLRQVLCICALVHLCICARTNPSQFGSISFFLSISSSRRIHHGQLCTSTSGVELGATQHHEDEADCPASSREWPDSSSSQPGHDPRACFRQPKRSSRRGQSSGRLPGFSHGIGMICRCLIRRSLEANISRRPAIALA